MHEADDSFDIITLIMVLAVFTPIMIWCTIPFLKGDVGGFGVQIEKTALTTQREIIPEQRVRTTDDVILMLVVADEYTPRPKSILLNTGASPLLIPINDDFLADRIYMLQMAKTVMPDRIPIQLDLFVDPVGMRYWGVQAN